MKGQYLAGNVENSGTLWVGLEPSGKVNKAYVAHEMFHAIQYAYPSVYMAERTDQRGYLLEGLAALAEESWDGDLESSDLHSPRPVGPSALSPRVKDPSTPEEKNRNQYPYQMQDFFEWMAKADPQGASSNLKFIQKILGDTNSAEINQLPAWDPRRLDYVIRNNTGFKDGLGEVYQGFIQDQLTKGNGQVYIDLNLPGIQEVTLSGETLSTDIAIESLGTTLVKIIIPAGKTAQDMLADFAKLKGARPLILYDVNGDYLYVAFISGDITPLVPNDPSTTGKYKVEVMELSGAWSSNFGDPHIATPDLNRYSFQAVGDYVLTRSTDPEDNFEIQVRYTPFVTDGKQWSGENALAMMVGADKVELYALTDGGIEIYVNDEAVSVETNGVLSLQRGTISRTEEALNVSWSDGTLLVASLTSPDPTKALRGFTKVYFPPTRRSRVEGLLGNFDGKPENDFKIRDGQTLNAPTELELYVGGYRDSWSIQNGASESLFSQGSDPYDFSYPGNLISFDDFFASEVEKANQTCRAEGITDSFFLKACALDVLVTGNPAWAQNTAAASIGLVLFTPSLSINPPAVTLVKSGSYSFEALVRGTTSDVVWEVSGGSITSNGTSVEFTPPPGGGEYTLTAKLTNDPSYIETAKIIVVEPIRSDGPYQINLTWSSSRYGGSFDAHLWLPNNNGCHISPLNRGAAATAPFTTFDQDGSTPNPYGPGGGDPEIITIHKRLATGQYEYAVERRGDS
jgi:von Willebrand factor type D domain